MKHVFHIVTRKNVFNETTHYIVTIKLKEFNRARGEDTFNEYCLTTDGELVQEKDGDNHEASVIQSEIRFYDIAKAHARIKAYLTWLYSRKMNLQITETQEEVVNVNTDVPFREKFYTTSKMD